MPSATDSAAHIGDFDTSIPTVGTTTVSQLDDFIRHVKTVLKTDFGAVTGAVTSSHTELNVLDGIPATLTATELGYVDGVTSAIQTQLDAKAPLASPTFTGTPTLPTGTVATTQTTGNSSTKVATTAFVQQELATQYGNWVLIKSTATGTGANVDFVNGSGGVVLNSTYDVYLFELIQVKPGTDDSPLALRTSTDAGVSYDAGTGYIVVGNFVTSGGGSGSSSSSGGAEVQISSSGAGSGVGGGANEDGLSGTITVFKPSASTYCHMLFQTCYMQLGALWLGQGSGVRAAAADVDAIRFFWTNAANFASGTINLYGRRK